VPVPAPAVAADEVASAGAAPAGAAGPVVFVRDLEPMGYSPGASNVGSVSSRSPQTVMSAVGPPT
jgi:hypothetical protein